MPRTSANGREEYELELTNFEVKAMFRSMIRRWFGSVGTDYGDFIRALLLGDAEAMNLYMNRVTQEMFGSFDTGKRPSEKGRRISTTASCWALRWSRPTGTWSHPTGKAALADMT